MNAPMQLLYRVRRMLLRALRIPTRGVKVMLFDAGNRILLIRNTYGNTRLFVLPGGGIRPFESPADAARRELREETGICVAAVTPVSVDIVRTEGRRDTVHVFTATSAELPQPDGVEVAEARFFALDALPESVSPATLRWLTDYRGPG